MTPYETHEKLGHHMTRYSPNGVDIVEECSDCPSRWLHNPCLGYPVSLDPLPSQLKKGYPCTSK